MGKIGWAISGSIALHVGLIGIFWPKTLEPTISTNRRPLKVVLIPALVNPTFSKNITASLKNEPEKENNTLSKTPLRPSSTPELPTSHQIPEKPNFDPEGYFPIDEVDQPAIPLDDWSIDTDILPRGYTLRLVLKLWISASGNIDYWELGEMPTDPQLTEKALRNIYESHIQPARKNHATVRSFRELEVIVSRD